MKLTPILPQTVRAGVYDASQRPHRTEKRPPRVVDFYELELCLSFTQHEAADIDGTLNPVEPGSVIVAKPGQKRYPLLTYRCYYLHFSPEPCIRPWLDGMPDVMNASDFHLYQSLFRCLISEYNAGDQGNELLIQTKCLELLCQIHQDAVMHERTKVISRKAAHAAIIKAIDYIDENYSQPIRLEDIAASAGFSPFYFHKLFSAATKKTPRRYILEKRLRAAEELLLTGETTLTETAFACGFSSQSYFNFIFKKENRQTPKQFRAQRQKCPSVGDHE